MDNSFSGSNLRSKYGRSMVTFGGPITGYSDVFDERINQQSDFVSFLRDLEQTVRQHSSSEMEILIMNRLLVAAEIPLVADQDLLLSVISIVLVLGYMSIHLRSVVLSVYGMF